MKCNVCAIVLSCVACLLTASCVLQKQQESEIRREEEPRSGYSQRAVLRVQTDMVDKPAPDFLLPALDGNILKLSDFKGQVIIVNFWGTWCSPCRSQIPHFMALYEAYQSQGFMMLGVAVDRSGAAAVRRFVKANPVNYLILAATDEVQDAYGGIPNVPTTFLIDRTGKIRNQYIGYRDQEVFEEDIKVLLAEK